jgi:hypothetical protein
MKKALAIIGGLGIGLLIYKLTQGGPDTLGEAHEPLTAYAKEEAESAGYIDGEWRLNNTQVQYKSGPETVFCGDLEVLQGGSWDSVGVVCIDNKGKTWNTLAWNQEV